MATEKKEACLYNGRFRKKGVLSRLANAWKYNKRRGDPIDVVLVDGDGPGDDAEAVRLWSLH